MESAIPLHLKTERTRHKRMPDDYQPPYPSFVARYKPAVSRVVMAYFGVQYRGAAPNAATEALAEIARRFGAEGGPLHWDRARYLDQAGYETIISVAYWNDIARFDTWFEPAREARLLGRDARPYPTVANRCDGARQRARADPRRREAAREGA